MSDFIPTPYLQEIYDIVVAFNDLPDATDILLEISQDGFENTPVTQHHFDPTTAALLERHRENKHLMRETRTKTLRSDGEIKHVNIVTLIDYQHAQILTCTYNDVQLGPLPLSLRNRLAQNFSIAPQ